MSKSSKPSQGRISDAYATLIGRLAFAWGWPMMNVRNRRAAFADLPSPGLIDGIVPVAPSNYVSMLHDYVSPDERMVACPNQDVIYGFGILALDQEPAVVQVPDFGDRFWVYQIGDQRTDGFGKLGKMYGSAPGHYLLWVPRGTAMRRRVSPVYFARPRIRAMSFRASSSTIPPLIVQPFCRSSIK